MKRAPRRYITSCYSGDEGSQRLLRGRRNRPLSALLFGWEHELGIGGAVRQAGHVAPSRAMPSASPLDSGEAWVARGPRGGRTASQSKTFCPLQSETAMESGVLSQLSLPARRRHSASARQ